MKPDHDDTSDWGEEEGNARAVSAFVLMLTRAMLDIERGRGPAPGKEQEAREAMLWGIAESRRVNAEYLASGEATQRFRKLVAEAERFFQRFEQWAAHRSERLS